MIKKFLIASVVLLFPNLLPAQSQPEFGVRLSFDVTRPAGANDGINNGSGFDLTGVYNIPIKGNFFVEPGIGVFYNTMGIRPVEYENSLFDGSIRNFGIRVPLNAGYSVELFDNFEMSAFTGPWFNISLSSKAHLDANFERPMPTGSMNVFDYGWHHFDAQWGFGISATYANQYYIGISGGIGMTPMATFTKLDHKDRIRRNTVSVTVGYNF